MEQVLHYHSGPEPRRFGLRGAIVLALAVLGVIISVGMVGSGLLGWWRLRFIRVHGLGLLVMALGPPLIAIVASVVVASTMGRQAEARRGRRLAIAGIVLSVLNIVAVVAAPVVLALSFGMGRTLSAEER